MLPSCSKGNYGGSSKRWANPYFDVLLCHFCASLFGMNATLDPIVSEFETEDQAASHDRWFRAKVQEAIDSKKPRIPHEKVMAEMEAIIAQAEAPKT